MASSSSSHSPRIQPRGDNVRSRRDALASTLDYIASAPIQCCQAALHGIGHQMGGPDGTCILYNAQGGDASRIKIPKKATTGGRTVPTGGVGVLFSQYNANQKSDIIQIVLIVHRRDLFDRLRKWAKRELTLVIKRRGLSVMCVTKAICAVVTLLTYSSRPTVSTSGNGSVLLLVLNLVLNASPCLRVPAIC